MTTWLGSAVVNHLWQSTLFAVVVWLATLALRRNGARVRYWLWTAASVKFLVPFAWLVSFGALFQWRTAPAMTQPAVSFVMDEVLTPPVLAAPQLPTVAPPSSVLQWVMLAVWLAGTLAVLFWWWRQWRPVRAALRQAVPLDLGPMCETSGIRVMSSPSAFEPGVVGIVRPLLVVPDGLVDRLTSAQLNALIAHERSHIRCHDNLAAIVHMLVEGIFWFHPLVWWIERRMIDERERACDEAVLRSGNDPAAYAEGILTVCRFTVRAPVACVTGVTGSDLRRRIESIARRELGTHMTVARRVALTFFIASVVGIPVMVGVVKAETPLITVGQEPDAPVFFEVAAVRRNTSGSLAGRIQHPAGGGFTASNVQLKVLITHAYDIAETQLIGAPDWIASERFDITARLEREPASARDDRRLALRSLLAERFKLVMHRDTREFPMFALVTARSDRVPGPGLRASSTDCSPEGMRARAAALKEGRRPEGVCGSVFSIGGISFGGFPMSEFAKVLSPYEGRAIVDRTGLTGNWDFELRFTPDRAEPPVPGQDQPVIDPNGPSFTTALQEQLGLKLEPTKGLMEVLVVDRVEPLTDDQASAAPQPVPARPTFEVVSIRRNSSGSQEKRFDATAGRFIAQNVTLRMLIQQTYNVQDFQMDGGPDWMDSEHFDIEARAPDAALLQRRRPMLQALLEDRFRLKVRRETRTVPVYLLTLAKNGPALKKGNCLTRDPGVPLAPGQKQSDFCGFLGFGGTAAIATLRATGVDMKTVAAAFEMQLQRSVIDETSLTGQYDVTLRWTPDTTTTTEFDSTAPTFFTAVREQLGLQLEGGRKPASVLVIESAERPSSN